MPFVRCLFVTPLASSRLWVIVPCSHWYSHHWGDTVALFTRKHFQMIAEVIFEQDASNDLTGAQMFKLAEDFADTLAQYNPRFDRERFLAAALEGR